MRRIATALLTLTLAASAGAIERLRDVPLQANALAATRPSVRAALGRAAPAGPTAAELAKMEAAAPDKPRVRPERPRRLLVFSLAFGYKHSSIPYGKKMTEIFARKTGAFEVTITDDPAAFEAESLARFDAVLLNNTNNEIFLPEDYDKLPPDQQARARERDERLKRNLVEFVRSGKGLAAIHAGLASFRKWEEWGDIIGGRFVSHPWNSGSVVTLRIDEPDHPVALAFGGPSYVHKDEIYQFAPPYSRARQRVLVSLDTAKTDMTKKGIVRTDGDFGLSWVKPFGQGRIFYCAFGHDHDVFWNPVMLQHYLDGIQFALGDLKADYQPR